MDDVRYRLPNISTEKPADRTSVFFTGFPLQATDPITSVGAVAGFVADGGYTTIMIDKNAWPGASGSPVYLADGKTIVGMILRMGTGDAIGLSFGVNGGKITEVLNNARKNWDADDKKKIDNPTP